MRKAHKPWKAYIFHRAVVTPWIVNQEGVTIPTRVCLHLPLTQCTFHWHSPSGSLYKFESKSIEVYIRPHSSPTHTTDCRKLNRKTELRRTLISACDPISQLSVSRLYHHHYVFKSSNCSFCTTFEASRTIFN